MCVIVSSVLSEPNFTNLQLTNVSHGTGLEAAEAYLARVEGTTLPADGDIEAMPYWDDLHKDGQAYPGLLNRYEGAAMQTFDKILREAMGKIGFSFGKLPYDQKYIIAMRNVYTTFAEYYKKQPGDHARRLCASIRLYARLPTWKIGNRDNSFFPAAILPARSWMAALSSKLRGNSDSAALMLVSEMIP